jgi:hypothetical protein
MQVNPLKGEKSLSFIEDFLCAGSSALILSLIHLYPAYWFLSIFALLPFLWRLTSSNLLGSIVLGIILGNCYAVVAFTDQILISPSIFLLKLFSLCLIFSAFGVAVNRINKYTGFNPIFIAALWLPFEYALCSYAHMENIFLFSGTDSSLLIRISSLFGVLMVSFVIVLINSLILIAIRRAVKACCSETNFSLEDDKISFSFFKEVILQKLYFYYPMRRAPPIHNLL